MSQDEVGSGTADRTDAQAAGQADVKLPDGTTDTSQQELFDPPVGPRVDPGPGPVVTGLTELRRAQEEARHAQEMLQHAGATIKELQERVRAREEELAKAKEANAALRSDLEAAAQAMQEGVAKEVAQGVMKFMGSLAKPEKGQKKKAEPKKPKPTPKARGKQPAKWGKQPAKSSFTFASKVKGKKKR